MDRIAAWAKAERAKLRGMSLRGKLSYIVTYYWVQLGLIIYALAFGLYLHSQMSVQLAGNHFAACFANTTAELGPDSEFGRGFARYAGYDLKQKNLVLLDECWCHPDEPSALSNTYYNLLVTYLDSGTLDVLVMPEADLAAVGKSGRLMDLRDERTAALFDTYQDRLIFVTPNAQSDYGDAPVPVGIDLAGTPLVGENAPYGESAVLGVSALAPHPEQAGIFLKYLFEEEGACLISF
ncbi:MAG: hypothetical protein ACI4XW_10675 [Candidatus Spyradocola sp.]